MKWTLDGASFSLRNLWAQREAVIAAAPAKGVLKLRSHQCWLGLPAACLADFTLLEGSVGMGLPHPPSRRGSAASGEPSCPLCKLLF